MPTGKLTIDNKEKLKFVIVENQNKIIFSDIMDEDKEVKIPKRIVEKIEERIKDTDFKSLEEYVTFVLEEVIKDEESQDLSKEDEEKIKEKLKALGYL